jgi:hypothetical protein
MAIKKLWLVDNKIIVVPKTSFKHTKNVDKFEIICF